MLCDFFFYPKCGIWVLLQFVSYSRRGMVFASFRWFNSGNAGEGVNGRAMGGPVTVAVPLVLFLLLLQVSAVAGPQCFWFLLLLVPAAVFPFAIAGLLDWLDILLLKTGLVSLGT